MKRVACYAIKGHGKSELLVGAMARGAQHVGYQPIERNVTDHVEADCDVAVFWGFIEECQKIAADYTRLGKPWVYLDMGYWAREGGNAGHFKVSVNARHPTKYFQRFAHSQDRARKFGVDRVRSYRSGGRPILLAGMSAKAAWAEGLEPVESFERRCVAALRNVTDRPIIYRPKPSYKAAQPIEGTIYSPPEQNLAAVLADSHAVVTHHSNVAIDGLVDGVPCFVWDGVATLMGSNDLREIETPRRPPNRLNFCADLAYCQWSVTEMHAGTVWRHLKSEGLVP